MNSAYEISALEENIIRLVRGMTDEAFLRELPDYSELESVRCR